MKLSWLNITLTYII